MYALVADVERYPEFLPWCVGARIMQRENNTLRAELLIGFKAIRERFTSVSTFEPERRIDVQFAEGPFEYLNGRWLFEADPAGTGCVIDFRVDFEFRNRILGRIVVMLFDEAVRRMVRAFEQRAHALYGTAGKR